MNNVENIIRDPVILGEIISGVFCMSANAAIGIPHTKTGPLLFITFLVYSLLIDRYTKNELKSNNLSKAYSPTLHEFLFDPSLDGPQIFLWY